MRATLAELRRTAARLRKPQSHVIREAAARLYKQMARPRGREIDLAIAASAIVNGAAIWTLNPSDFKDVPGLRLI